jgi:hypothetical protein
VEAAMSENVGTRSYQPRARDAILPAMRTKLHVGEMILGALIALFLIASAAA